MPGWYYDKKELRNTPSMQDGLDYDTEIRYRKEGARFIIQTGVHMDLGYNTTATGVVYFHRFYMFHSFRQFPRYVTACCCLFLAGKVEETPKKCKDIIKAARQLLTDQKFATFGEDPKEEVMTLERILLQTIKFDLQVEHPYSYLLKYAKCLKGEKTKLEKMVQMAWTFVNDSWCTTLSLQWEPEIIAVALMYLAGKLSQFEVVDWVGRTAKHLRWWDMFVEDVTMDLLEDICHQVLDLYSPTNTSASSAPESPPLQSKAGQPSSSTTTAGGSTVTTSPSTAPITTPTSTNNTSSSGHKPTNGQEKMDTQEPHPIINTNIPPPSDIPPYPYQSFTSAPPPNFPAAYTTPAPMAAPPHLAGPPPGPPPHIAAPPPTVFPPFVTHPPPFTSVVPPGAPFFPPGAPHTQHPPHRQFYPPP